MGLRRVGVEVLRPLEKHLHPPPFPHVFGTRQPAASTGSSQPRQPGTELPPAEVNLVPCLVVEMVQLRRGLGRQPL